MQRNNGSDLSSSPSPQQWIPPQQWMHYPAAAMAMMQQQQQMMMMYPHHPYMGFYQHQQPPQYHNNKNFHHRNQSKSPEDSKTIWVGDLLHWMDETYLHSCFSHSARVSSVKVIRNKHTGQPEGYGFVEFDSHSAAEKVLHNYNGSLMPNADQPFRLNWASFAGDRPSDTGSDLSIFVGDLAADVTDAVLLETFSSKYPSVRGAKVVTDPTTGRSKGYGFVRFGNENERSTAMTEMNGVYCSSRPMRIGVATPKRSSAYQHQYSSQALVLAAGHASNGAVVPGSQLDGDSNNTTIFVGGVDSDTSDEDLRQPFSQFGEVVSVKIPNGKGCGFVQFADRKSAEDALHSLNGTTIGNQPVRLSWGRSPAKKQWRREHNNAYYGGQGYGYAMAANEEGNMYVAAAS